MTIHRAVLLLSSNSAKFSYRDGWHSCEHRSYSLFSVSRMGCQTHAANKINTDRSSLDFLVASIHMNGQIRRRRPVFFFFFLHPATSRFFQHSSRVSWFRLPPRPRSHPPFYGGWAREVDHISDSINYTLAHIVRMLKREWRSRSSSLRLFPDTRRATLRIPCAALPMPARPGTHSHAW